MLHTLIGILAMMLAPLLPPCETEDSRNCHWDASVQGDSFGTSFVDLDGTAYYGVE